MAITALHYGLQLRQSLTRYVHLRILLSGILQPNYMVVLKHNQPSSMFEYRNLRYVHQLRGCVVSRVDIIQFRMLSDYIMYYVLYYGMD